MNKYADCKLYRGEKENHYSGDKAMIWNCERVWFNEKDKGDESDLLRSCMREYVMKGLIRFQWDDDTPMSLKAVLLNRYYHQDGIIPYGCESFKEWYLKYYCYFVFT